MFSKPAEAQSIASQLVLLFTLTAGLVLCCGLGLFYAMVVRHAFEEDNAFLADKLLALRASLRTPGWPQTLNQELRTDRLGEPRAYWIRLMDSDGRIVAQTPGMDQILPATVFPSRNSKTAAAPRLRNYRTRGKLFSLVTTAERADGKAYLVQLAQDRSADAQFTRQFGILLGSVLILGVLISTVIAVRVTRRGLTPLGQMTEALQRTGPSHLAERVGSAGWPTELQPLAAAFDAMLDRLEDSFNRLSQFSADLAHELRTPVSNLLGEAQVALTKERKPEEYRETIESSVAECERLSGIIENLLFLARAEGAAEHIECKQFDGRKEVEKIAALYEGFAEDQRIATHCSGEGMIYADPALFGRALSNLLDNAVRFNPAGGRIDISITAEPTRSVIVVSDTGCGIPSEHLPRVFDRFYRVDSSRSSRGTGLGLALVKSIADLHGGSVVIESTLNTGTTVTLAFPNPAGPEAC